MARKASQNPSDQSAMPEPNGDMVAELQAMRQRLAECEEREAGYAQQTKQLRAQYRIADAASAVEDIRSFYRQVHTIVGTLMYAENLFIALYDAQSDLITWEYWVDTIDVDVPPPIRLQDHHGATGWVLRNGRTLADTDGSAQKAYDAGELELVGSDSDGIAIPLKNDDITVGVLLVQSYLKEFRYSVQDVETLAFAGQHISTALHRAQLLEETQQRNAELAIINSVQAGLASKLDMLEIEGWELAAYFQAARKVAGDFYDAFLLAGTGRIGIVLGDVCDKGVGAALFMT